MKIRAVTIGHKLPFLSDHASLENSLQEILREFQIFSQDLIEAFKNVNIEVQSKRLCSQPILSYDQQELFEHNLNQMILQLHDEFSLIERYTNRYDFDYFACCSVLADKQIEKYGVYEKLFLNELPSFIKRRKKLFSSLPVASTENGINLSALRTSAKIIKQLSDPDPFKNLNFCVSSNVKPDIPFFPAAYHLDEKPCFSLALEMADEVNNAIESSKGFGDAQVKLRERFIQIYIMLNEICSEIADKYQLKFHGIDFSPAPYPEYSKSIGTAFEKLNFEYFGSPGSLLGVALIKSAIPNFDKVIGFSGFMPSVLEDLTISKSLTEDKFNLDTLLLYSTICGTGLDCVPLPGDITERELFYILLDMCTISVRLNKPLTARLMPIVGMEAGDDVQFDFEYFSSSKIMNIRRIGKKNEKDLFSSKEKRFSFMK